MFLHSWVSRNANFLLCTHILSLTKCSWGYLHVQDTSLTVFSAECLGLAVSGSGLLWNVCKENDDFSMMIIK